MGNNGAGCAVKRRIGRTKRRRVDTIKLDVTEKGSSVGAAWR